MSETPPITPPTRHFIAEPLESRRMLAGVTLLMHGNDGNITGWISAADAIAKRAGGSQVSHYVMRVGENSSGNLAVKAFTLQKGPHFNVSTMSEAIVKVDWTEVDEGEYSTVAVGKVVASYLLEKHGTLPALAELPIHLIGHSRGASMVSAISGQLALRGVWVDQNTFLDPHPVDFFFADFGDAPMRVWSNVVFADNYWRTDGNPFNFDPDGERVAGAYDGDLNNTVQDNYFVSAHMAVTSYYHGTIDTGAVLNKEHPILSSWYGNTTVKPAKNKTGYIFSRIGGGSRAASGLSTEFGGTAARRPVGPEGTQWANAINIRTTNGLTFQSGEKISMRVQTQDRDSASTISVFLDRDLNPYNNNNARTMRRVELADNDAMNTVKISGATTGVAPGRYYIAARITDPLGHTRFSYARRIEITAAAPAATASFSGAATATAFAGKFSAVRIAEQVLTTA